MDADLLEISSRFPAQVHAEICAIVALREVKRQMDAHATRESTYCYLSAEIARRCQRLGLRPDVLCDEIEQAEDAARDGNGGQAA